MIELLIIGASFILAAILIFVFYGIGLAQGKLQAVKVIRETAEKYKTPLEKLYDQPRDTFGYSEETLRLYLKVRAYSQERLDALKRHPAILEIHPGEVQLRIDHSRPRRKGKTSTTLREIEDTEALKNVEPVSVGEVDDLSQMVDEAQPLPRRLRNRGKHRTH